jgi:hypothetical protein
MAGLTGAQFYIACLNVDVINGGNARPEGEKFPGAYTKESVGTPIYLPFEGDSPDKIAKGNALNSKYVSILYPQLSSGDNLTHNLRFPLDPQFTRPVTKRQKVHRQWLKTPGLSLGT